MESVKKLFIFQVIFIFSALAAMSVHGKVKEVGRLYYQGFMGHLHKEASDGSASLTALQCAHSVVLLEKEGRPMPSGWRYARVGEDEGFIRSKFLGEKRPECFQEKYPKFYNNLNLDLTDYYYWGRLSDHFIEGESLAP